MRPTFVGDDMPTAGIAGMVTKISWILRNTAIWSIGFACEVATAALLWLFWSPGLPLLSMDCRPAEGSLPDEESPPLLDELLLLLLLCKLAACPLLKDDDVFCCGESLIISPLTMRTIRTYLMEVLLRCANYDSKQIYFVLTSVPVFSYLNVNSSAKLIIPLRAIVWRTVRTMIL